MTVRKTSTKKASAKKASAKKASAKKASAKKSLMNPDWVRMSSVDVEDIVESLTDNQVYLDVKWDERSKDMRHGRWDTRYPTGQGTAFVPSLTSFSDYSGSAFERSNAQMFKNEFEELSGRVWKEAYGSDGNRSIVIKADRVTPEINDFFGALAEKASTKKSSAKKASSKKASAKKVSAKNPSTKKSRKTNELETVDPRDLANSLSEHEVYLGNEWDDDDGDIRYGSWDRGDRTRPGNAFVPSLTEFSDYSGTSVERSNFRVFEELFKDLLGKVWKVSYGGYGTKAIVIKADRVTPEINDFFGALDDYPLADENDHSELEMNLQDEAWENVYGQEFIKGLNSVYAEWGDVGLNPPDLGDIMNGDETFDLFRGMADEANVYWEIETGGNAWIDIDRIIEKAIDGYNYDIEQKLRRAGFVPIPDLSGLDHEDYMRAAEAALRLGRNSRGATSTLTMPWVAGASLQDMFSNAVAANKDYDVDVSIIADPGIDQDVLESLFDFFMAGYNSKG